MIRDLTASRPLRWGLAFLMLVTIEYLCISNASLSPVASDTIPAGGEFSLAPLKGVARRVVGCLSYVTLQPFLPIIRDATLTLGSRWTGRVFEGLFPFRSMVANHLWFSLVNSVVWLACIALLVRLYRVLSRRYRSREG
jgi:hypothetical protein